MIYLVTTQAHAYTHRELTGLEGMPPIQIVSYHHLFRDASLSPGTWIFTDMDRLGFWELELAAIFYRQARDAGMRVLNDPARACQRFALLRRLHNAGINRFNAWRVENGEMPDRYPVFLRTVSAHRGVISDLLYDTEQVRAAVEDALESGYPARELILVEYCAEPVREGLYRKLGIHRIGERLVPALCAHQEHWVAKRGQIGIAGQELYDDEHRIIIENPFANAIRPVFETAAIEYGRADFALVGGRPQIYEINTNPTVRSLKEHPFPVRMKSSHAYMQTLLEAYTAIDTPAIGPSLAVDIRTVMQQRGRKGVTDPDEWMP